LLAFCSFISYFIRGDLDIDLMRDAAKRLIGEHDYRNFCKMDVANGVVTFFRRIDDISIRVLDNESSM
jgi:tRNA pseudouridine38/39 synthase